MIQTEDSRDELTIEQKLTIRISAVELANKVIFNSVDMGTDLLIYAQKIEHFLLTGQVTEAAE